jgi:hypothetical protein
MARTLDAKVLFSGLAISRYFPRQQGYVVIVNSDRGVDLTEVAAVINRPPWFQLKRQTGERQHQGFGSQPPVRTDC